MKVRKGDGVQDWLLLMHQLPPQPDSFRVKIWRKLQRVGAVALKNSVYVLPNTSSARLSLGKVVEEIRSGGGEAFLCDARFLEGVNSTTLVQQFNVERDKGYLSVSQEVEPLIALFKGSSPPSTEKQMKVAHVLGKMRRQLDELIEIDFFSAKGRTRAERLVSELEARATQVQAGPKLPPLEAQEIREFQGRVWVTRCDLYVDRLASAWVIRRFIDPKAKFKFVKPESQAVRAGEIRFDMVGGEFTHHGDLCTFEVLIQSFGLKKQALTPIAEIIHDIDLNDRKYQREETAGIERVIKGIVKAEKDDDKRVLRAERLFDELVATFDTSRRGR